MAILCMFVYLWLFSHPIVFVTHLRIHEIYVCIYACTYVCMYICVYYACMYVCMYVRMQRFNSLGTWRHVKLTNSSRYFQEICCLNVQTLSSKDLQNICNYFLWTLHHIPEDLNLQHGHCMKSFNMVVINNGLLWFDIMQNQSIYIYKCIYIARQFTQPIIRALNT
jgi:hypothetical protein